jgi:hypothetical protein
MSNLEQVNYDHVFEALSKRRLTEWDQEIVAAAVVKAVETWAEEDSTHARIEGVELYGEEPAPYKIDVLL